MTRSEVCLPFASRTTRLHQQACKETQGKARKAQGEARVQAPLSPAPQRLGWVGWVWVIVARRDAFSFPEKLGSVMVVSGKHPPPPAVDFDDLRYPANQRQAPQRRMRPGKRTELRKIRLGTFLERQDRPRDQTKA